MALASQTPGPDRTTAELVRDLLSQRTRFEAASTDRAATGPAGPVGDALAYDASLIRLCDRLQIDHGLTEDGIAAVARKALEAELASRLPVLAAAFSGEPTAPRTRSDHE